MKKYYFVLLIISIIVLSAASGYAQEKVDEPKEPSSGGTPFAQSKFVPDISFILDFSVVGRNISNDTMKETGIPGFKNDATAARSPLIETEQDLNTNNGFNFNYGELAITSTVDPYFDLAAILTVTGDGIDIEEAYCATRSLPFGLQMRLGKFKSSFGRINEQHEHFWDFADQPRVYDVFFGQEGLNDEGIRLNFLVPVGFYLLIGTEVFRGVNEASFGVEGFHDESRSVSVRSSNTPNTYTQYIKTSFDYGDLIFLLGISNAYGKTRQNQGIDTADAPGASGSAIYTTTDIAGADVTIKYLIDSYRYVSLQTEYLYRYMIGRGYEETEGALTDYRLKKKQSGLYSQLVARFAERWRAGIRYELLQQNDTYRDGNRDSAPQNMPKYSAMIDWSPTEFSRIRIQYNYDRTLYLMGSDGSSHKNNHEVILQFTMAIGAHGAHSF